MCARVYVRYSPDIGTGLVICNVVYFDVMQCNANVIYVVTGVRLTCVRGAHNGGGATGLWSFSGGVALTLVCLPWLLASLPASKPPHVCSLTPGWLLAELVIGYFDENAYVYHRSGSHGPISQY